MFWAKIFTTKAEILVAICDELLLDQMLKFKNKVDVKISKYFYGEKLIDEKTALRAMGKATIGNLIGKEICKLAEKNGFITKENIINIDGIPHAQFIKVEG